MQKSNWIKGSPIQRTSLNKLLDKAFDGDFQDLMTFRGFWQDGQAGTSWLTSTHIGDWVQSGDRKPWSLRSKNQREMYFLNHKKMMVEAADKLDSMFWIGIVEDMERSIELLEHQLRLEKGSLKMVTANKNESKDRVSEASRSALASLVGVDRWLFDYGKRVFEARYHHYKTGNWTEPVRPSLIGK